MVRARIVVDGRVQDVGYRTIIRQIARGLKIKGMIRNLKDGSVEMFCETDRRTLEKFKKMINIKSPPEDLFGANVEKIDEHTEHSKKYINPPEKFGYFRIDYLDEDLLKTSVERAEAGIISFKAMHKDLKEGQKELKEEQKAMHKDMIKGQASIKDSIQDMHQDMNQKFDWTAERYGDISKGVNEIKGDLREIKRMRELFAKLVNHIVKEEK